MNIESYIEECRKVRNGESFAFLAERCQTSVDTPYRIKVAEPVKPDEVLVLVIAGTGGNKVNLRGYNSILKKTDVFIKSSKELKDENIRVCVAVAEFGQYHIHRQARKSLYHKVWFNESIEEFAKDLPEKYRQETLHPKYIQDIFDLAIFPRLHQYNQRFSLFEAMQNMRKLNIVSHCHGAYVALCLEKLMTKKMIELGYSPDEQIKIKNQLAILAYNPDCPKHAAQTHFIAIESSQDNHNRYQTYLREWLLMNPKDFGVCYVQIKHQGSRTLMCAQVDKHGVEGNPARTLQVIDISDFFDQRHSPNTEKSRDLGEHDFLGYEQAPNMSNGAKKLQLFANNILKNLVLNSCQQTKDAFYPIPLIQNLASNTPKQKFLFAKAAITGYYLQKRLELADKKKIDQYANWRRSIPVIELD